MNTATRIITQDITVDQSRSLPISIQFKYVLTGILLLAVMLSAVCIVYVTDLNRHEFSDLQDMQLAKNDLNTQYGQLLLEQNTWAAPARVQQIAEQHLNMYLPEPQAVVMVHQ